VTEADDRAVRLERELDSVRREHQGTLNEVGRLAGNIARLTKEIRSLNSEFETFREDEIRARNRQYAQTRLIDIRADRDRKFGHYDAVRRGTLGILQAMDAGIVTQSALQQAAERLMIDTPGYWLAPAQVAIAAWINNNEGLANRALVEAMARDPNKATLFFCLVLARHERYEATAKWMYEYINRQDPMALSREFTVVLDAAVQGALGERAFQLVKQRCITWHEQLRTAETIVHQQTELWQRQIERKQKDIAGHFVTLARCSPDWPSVAKWLNASTVYEETETWLRNQLDTTEVRQDGLRQRVDGVLRSLVTEYDQIEDSLRQEELVWSHAMEEQHDNGFISRLRAASADDENTDFMSLLTKIGISPEQAGASRATMQLALRLSAQWVTAAADSLSRGSLKKKYGNISIKIEGWRGTVNDNGDHAEALSEFDQYVEGEMRQGLGRVNAQRPIRASVAALMLFLLSVAGIPLVGPSLLYLASAIGSSSVLMVICGTWLLRSWRELPVRKNEIRRISQRIRNEGHSTLQRSALETQQILEQWDTNQSKKNSLIDYIGDQTNFASLISIPIDPKDSSPQIPAASTTAPSPLIDNPDDPPYHPGDEQSFAFRLPKWDQRPPLWMNDHAHNTEP
jgi:hypothetical protein